MVLQTVADAYYVLSDLTRRKEYDSLYSTRNQRERTNEPGASASFFSTFANMFGGGGAANAQGAPAADRPDADNVFADVFEEVSDTTAPRITAPLIYVTLYHSYYDQK